MRTDLGKCTHQCDETQGTMKHKRFRQKVFVRYKKIEERSREKDRQGVEVNKMLRVVHSLPKQMSWSGFNVIERFIPGGRCVTVQV